MERIRFYNILDLDRTYQEKLRIWRNQDFVREKMVHQHIISEEEHRDFLYSLSKNSFRKFYVAFRDTEPFGVLYYDYYLSEDTLEFGFYLIDLKYLNIGLGVLLEYAILEYAFYELKVEKVRCITLATNKKVTNLHTKFGFVTEQSVVNKLEEKEVELYHQTINLDGWRKAKEKIEKLVSYITSIDDIGNLS